MRIDQCRRLSSAIRERFLAYRYLFNGTSIIEDKYRKSAHEPFKIMTPEGKITMITSQRHIRELDKAPRHVLSLHAVAKKPKYTMHGFEWKDQRGIEGTGFVRALRSLLTTRLPQLIPSLKGGVQDQVATEISNEKVLKNGWRRVPLFAASKRMITRLNCLVFFPRELSEDPSFVKAALEFPEDVYLAAETIRILPRNIAPFIAKLLTHNHRSTSVMYEYLSPLVKQRMENAATGSGDYNGIQADDCVQWLIDTIPKSEVWSVDRLVGEIMAIWYGSLHTLAIATTYALVDLYSHPEYLASLKAEVDGPLFARFETTATGLPELDSFLKESARLSAFESTGIRRHALEEFKFSDGLRIPKGTEVSVPYRTMMRDDEYFYNALTFDGRRFLKNVTGPESVEKDSSMLSEPSDSWLVWGAGRISCPGRFYAVVVLKLVLSQILTGYECELEEIKGSRSVQWRTALIPKASITLRMRPRAKD
ncbi:hypothetical protein EYC84_008933 [Monilinia fructicola]|uniref:Cytochrome P450 n=1 Tax=Monilinia fructicola TaxID=38448 RepID=A0A5M9JCM5_MONFR|nr:hypothetical protein EYC84_008933 [Monilinia fructicola]